MAISSVLVPKTTTYVRARTVSGQAVVNLTEVIWDQVLQNVNNCYNSSTGIFTADKDGLYLVECAVKTQSVAASIGNALALNIRAPLAGPNHAGPEDVAYSTGARQYSAGNSCTVRLLAGETVFVRFNETLPAVNLDTSGNGENWLTITRVGNL